MAKGLGPDGVTPKQRACYEMRRQGKTWDEIGLAMSMSPTTARAHVKAAERNGLPQVTTTRIGYHRHVKPDPASQEKLLESLGLGEGGEGKFDMKRFAEFAQAAGIAPRLALALGRRIELNYGPVRAELKRLSLTEQVAATNEKAQMVLSYIDDLSIAGMNAKDLALAYGILVDKSQLLGGKPTHVYDFNLRAKLEVLMPAFLAEARRRGLTMDGTFTRIPEEEDADAGQTQENSQLQP